MNRPTRAVFAGAAVALALVACSFTRSLDYLTNGSSSGAPNDDAGSDAASSGGGGAGDAGIAIASNQIGPANLAQDADNLYWSVSDGSIMTAPKAGGAVRRIGAAGVVTAIAAEPTGADLFVVAGEKAQRVPKAGGAFVVIDAESPPPIALVVDDANVFVLHSDDDMTTGHVARFAVDGSGRAILSQDGDAPVAIALDGNFVLWNGSDADGNLVVFVLPKNAPDDAGALAHAILAGDDGIDVKSKSTFAVDDQAIYYVDYDTDDVRRAQRDASTESTLVLPAIAGAMLDGLVADSNNLYLLDARVGGGIVRVGKTMSSPTPIVPNQPFPTSLVVDDRALYFTFQGTTLGAPGSVVRTAK